MRRARGRYIVPAVVLAAAVGLGAAPARGQQAMVQPPESGSRELSLLPCAACHTPDGRPKGVGHGLKDVSRLTKDDGVSRGFVRVSTPSRCSACHSGLTGE